MKKRLTIVGLLAAAISTAAIAKVQWFATCDGFHGIAGTNLSSFYDDRDDADRQARIHNKRWPGHRAKVLSETK